MHEYISLLREEGFLVMADEIETTHSDLTRATEEVLSMIAREMEGERVDGERYRELVSIRQHYCEKRDKYFTRVQGSIARAIEELVLYRQTCLASSPTQTH